MLMKYVKYYWKYIDANTPVLVFAELDDERYSTRQVEVFLDRHIEIQGKNGAYVSEAPYPSNEEINAMDEFCIMNISKEEFESVWRRFPASYEGSIDFPEMAVL